MRINTNISALNTHRALTQNNDAVARSIGRLSSGLRINRAGDDAAGLAIANKFRADIRSLRVAQQNTTEAASVLQVAEGSATTISNILGRMKELATQASSYNADSQTGTLNDEFTALKDEIDRIVLSANYQGTKLLDGGFQGTFQVGTTEQTHDQLEISLGGGGAAGATVTEAYDVTGEIGSISWGDQATLAGLGVGTYNIRASVSGENLTFDLVREEDGRVIASGTKHMTDDSNLNDELTFALTTQSGRLIASFAVSDAFDATDFDAQTDGFMELFSVANAGGGSAGGLSTLDLGIDVSDLLSGDNAKLALTSIDSAIDTVNSFLGNIGSTQNRLEYAATNIATTIENYSASESAIRDADMAYEMTNFTRNQIMQQAATAMLAQANMAPQNILRLLG